MLRLRHISKKNYAKAESRCQQRFRAHTGHTCSEIWRKDRGMGVKS
jgi:hypothetical protein